MAISVGIDLGTTFSAVAYVNPKTNKPEIIPNIEGEPITPSIIYFYGDKTIFDSEAEGAFKDGISTCAATFKRCMGDDEPYFHYNGRAYKSYELSAMLLKHLKESAEEEIGDTIQNAVITVPAYFYSREREDTLKAAELAGLKVKKIIDEPNAAVLAYGIEHWRENANILVYDLGGGTFDVTLTHMDKSGELKSIVTRGDKYLGGRDWDNRLRDLLIEKFQEETDTTIEDDEDLLSIRGLCEDVKKKLSKLNSASVKASISGYGYAEVTVTRKEFEDATIDLVERTGALCNEVLEEAGIKWINVTDILLVGGSTRMPQVSTYLAKFSGKKPIAHVNPDEAVALGAAVQATKDRSSYVSLSVVEAGGKKVTDRKNAGLGKYASVMPKKTIKDLGLISLRETTAHAMGIVAIDDEKDAYYNDVIIPANHPRPVRVAKKFRFFTSSSSENELDIYVLQGNSEKPLDCVWNYKFVVSGIQHVKRGEKLGTIIRVQYSYDDNGVISVRARQETADVDLPIRKEKVPEDISGFGRPVSSESLDGLNYVSVKFENTGSNDVVHKFRAITFSNTEWEKYDNIEFHPSGAQFNESEIHVIANEEKIEFHGYNVSQMDEGVLYTIGASDDFEIECNIDTSTIQPHPGGNMIISIGIISAKLTQFGGSVYLGDDVVTDVGPKFKLKMVLKDNGHYEIYVDNHLVGEKKEISMGAIDVTFGFQHDSHCCSIISRAYVSNIKMMHRSNWNPEDDNSETDTWE